ncbi:heparan sulfate glucosamine 3-O-sulfotransferase 6-like isoform X2 [Neocloeon triangulifer]|uniref:heparan sulfate glucosamine 3-O-sulfotransferase 6-like isoform X2 n=1 Tax=Neocloeon triangulifer TaxID=2078957 RepID=UPI00286F50E9|nr:heparan sulfate glucosamine 3-O-sulfotransferase 6-like isoform X2 [Neocloeon triangulifer]
MLRIIVILIFRGINAMRRGKLTQNSRNCLFYCVLLLGLIYYNLIIRSAVLTARGILSKKLKLEDLIVNMESPIEEYEYNDSEENRTQKFPTTYLIGAPRCGTVALMDFLGLHPEVQIVETEIHYFDKYFSNGIDWYKSNMPLSTKYQEVIERCNSYFTNPAVPERIFKARPDAKIILGVRDPIERAVSEYAEMAEEARGKFYKPFREFAFDQGNLGKMNENWTVLQTGMYAKHLKPWFKYFPRHQIYIYTAEELVTNPAKIIKDLQVFLQIRYYLRADRFKINGTGRFPCISYSSESEPEPECLNETMKAVSLKHPNIEWSITHHLKNMYRQHMNDFYNMTGIRFGWI